MNPWVVLHTHIVKVMSHAKNAYIAAACLEILLRTKPLVNN